MAMRPTVLFLCVAAAAALSPSVASAAGLTTTTFKLYFHDVFGGPRPTAVRIAQAASSNSSSTFFFGAVVAIDDPLTSGPDRASSAEVGRAQGTYTFADQRTFGLLMQVTFAFTAGDHNGSSLAVFGRNEVLSAVREMSVVGGSGKFRMARGYVQARTVDSGAASSGETVVEYTVNVQA